MGLRDGGVGRGEVARGSTNYARGNERGLRG
jgi:hypothetical protein